MTTRILFFVLFLISKSSCNCWGEDRVLAVLKPFSSKKSVYGSERVEQTLQRRGAFEFKEVSIKAALDQIAAQYQIDVFVDKKSLSDAGKDLEEKVTCQLRDASVYEVLKTVLDQFELTFIVEDSVVKVTTEEEARQIMSTRVFIVGDLVNGDYAVLMRAIEASTTGPWESESGEGGTMTPVFFADALVIRHDQKNLREIEGIMAVLRRLKGLEPVPSYAISPTDVQVLHADPASLERFSSTRSARRSADSPWHNPRVYKSGDR